MDVREELLRLLRRGDVDGFNEISRRRRQIIDLTEADLSGARLDGIDLRGANLDGAKMARTRLRHDPAVRLLRALVDGQARRSP